MQQYQHTDMIGHITIFKKKKYSFQSCQLQNVNVAKGEHLKMYGYVLWFGLDRKVVCMG